MAEKWFPLEGKKLRAHWGFVFDVPDQPSGNAFVTGEILLRSDGALYRRYSRSNYEDGHTTYKYGPWGRVRTPWPGDAEPEDAKAFLKAQGYRLCEPLVASIEEHESAPIPGFPGEMPDLVGGGEASTGTGDGSGGGDGD